MIFSHKCTFLTFKTPCQQDGDDTFQEEDEESQAEMDAILIEKAGDMLPLLAQAIGGAAFKPYFEEFFPLIAKKTVSIEALHFCFQHFLVTQSTVIISFALLS